MEAVVFALSAALSLGASVLLVSRLERVGERLGVSEALLGLIAALAADGPEITSSVTAIAGGHGTVGIGVTLGSNVFNLAALLGISALVAGRIRFHRREIALEGAVGIWMAVVSVGVVARFLPAVVGLLLALVVFVPYVAVSAESPAARARIRLPARWSEWLARALAEEEAELAVAIRPKRADRRDGLVGLTALVVVVGASVAMEEQATTIGARMGWSQIIVGGLILAAVTSLPNLVAAIYLSSRGRGGAALSEAFNSNVFNVIVGLLLPGAILGIASEAGSGLLVALAYSALTCMALALAFRGHGLTRLTGSIIIAGYCVFVVAMAAA
jgi:cation:H+ antiporter